MTSSMDVFNGYKLGHGLAVIVRQQTQGRGMYYMWHLINILTFNLFYVNNILLSCNYNKDILY